MQDFKKLKIWEKAIQIGKLSNLLTRAFPKEYAYSLSDQINRSSVSISSNIAEGSSRSSQKDYLRFIEIALGSSYELESQLIIAEELQLGEPTLRDDLKKILDEEQKMLLRFRQVLLITK